MRKLGEDFVGAREQWSTMRSWTFVHNQHDGLPADIAQVLLRLKSDHPDVAVDQWSPARLLDLTTDLPEDRLARLFGHPPLEREMRVLHRGDIAEAVAGLALESVSWVLTDLPDVDPRKMDYNDLSEYPRRLLTAGITQAGMVDGYFENNPDPNLRDRAGTLLRGEWLDLQRQGVTGDDAFHLLHERVASNAKGSREASASLALLAYLFESCDVFDNPPPGWVSEVA